MREVIDLGREPWAFLRIEDAGQQDLALGCELRESEAAGSRTYSVDLGTCREVGSVRLVAPEIHAKELNLSVALAETEEAWRKMPRAPLRALPITQKTIGATGGTVGLAERVKGLACERVLEGRARHLKVQVDLGEAAALRGRVELQVFGPKHGRTDELAYAQRDFDDAAWPRLGVPHCFNEDDTYLNAREAPVRRATAWYRRRLRLPPGPAPRRAQLLFESVGMAAAVYVNGRFIPGLSRVPQPADVTHVGSFLPFALDITDALVPGENSIAVRVSNAERSFFTWPGFATFESFCMGWGGLLGPVKLVLTGEIHLPLEVFTAGERSGPYIATLSADDNVARVRQRVEVANDGPTDVTVTLRTTFRDDRGDVALSLSESRFLAARTLLALEQEADIVGPELWFPNGSPHGRPALYDVEHSLLVDDREVDRASRYVGLRTLSWDDDYCYVNGEQHLLRGFGQRNAYPALGAAVPAALQWRDMSLLADAGANTLRVGHVPATRATLEACDALGILVLMNSGDDEWSLSGFPASAYKPEFDRAMIVAFRNHASVAVWEANNGIAKRGERVWPSVTRAAVERWDPWQRRIVLTRDAYPEQDWPTDERIVVGYTNTFTKVPGSPSINTEVYGGLWNGERSHCAARFDYDNEKDLAAWYVDDYLHDIDHGACGWIHWLLAETQSEGYTILLDGSCEQRSLGSSALDGNRFPKLIYRIYQQALWVPFARRPGVALQSHWNLSGTQDVDAWSNCPAVELRLNGVSLGVRVPDPRTRRCTWPGVAWQPGKLTAHGLDASGEVVCVDERVTAGPPSQLKLELVALRNDPRSSGLHPRANGTDVALFTLTVTDAAGIWCPHAEPEIDFAVSGAGTYRGSYDFYTTPEEPLGFRAPGARRLKAEGGLLRVAVRAGFVPEVFELVAHASGLTPAKISCPVLPV